MPQVHPIYRVFLNFYAAICYELLGQSAHLYSNTKISLLNAALDCFVECGAGLPGPIPLPKLSKVQKTPPPSPPGRCPSTPHTPRRNLVSFDGGPFQSPGRESLVRSITRLIDISLWNQEDDDPFISDSEDSSETDFIFSLSPLAGKSARKFVTKSEKDRLFRVVISPNKNPTMEDKEPVKKPSLMPSPLRIHKFSKDVIPPLVLKPRSLDSRSSNKSSSQSRCSTRPLPPALPLRVIPTTKLNIQAQKSDKKTTVNGVKTPFKIGSPRVQSVKDITPAVQENSTEPISPARAARVIRYNHGLELLRSQISFNITSIQQHIDHVLAIQRTRRSRKMRRSTSFWSFDPVKSDEEGDDLNNEQEPVLDEFGNILVKETKSQRIARLRSDGWETVGLRSPRTTWKGAQYYQEFCAMVLSEMYMDQ